VDAPTTDLVRAIRESPEFRAVDESDSLGYLSGHVITWDDWYEVNSAYEGHFMETVARGATVKTITENRSAIKSLFDHGHDPELGNKVLGTFDVLEEDEQGLRYGVNLFDTSYNRDLLPGLKAGVYGSSHRFRVIPDKDHWNDSPERSERNPEGIPERTIREMAIFELGPVSFPANPKATAGVRSISLTDEWRSRHYHDLATPDREPAPQLEQEPPRHSGLTPGQRAFALRAFSI
jgi:HK97 family phage prohead protease